MKKWPVTCFVLAALLFSLTARNAPARDTEIHDGIKAAEEFLLLVDSGQYIQSWEAASSFFRGQVPREVWVEQIGSLRPAFGESTGRKMVSAQHVTRLPGAPDGSYVVIQYDTSFAHKRKAIETITPMLDKDGTWRVSGYFIQ